MKKLVLLLPFAIALAACGAPDAPPVASSAPATTAPADQPATPVPPRSANDLAASNLDRAIAGNWRSAKDKARDQYRHPEQTLGFFDVQPEDTLIEITPGGGWYADILAPLLNADGHYIAAAATPAKPDGEAARSIAALETAFKDNPSEFGNAKLIQFDPKAPNLGSPASADKVLTFRNVHNWVMGDTAPAMFKAFFEVLKPGGTLGVVDHRAAAGADFAKIKDSGYLPQDFVIKLATDAGFKLAAQSEINANPKDTKDYPKGVWTLPPTLTLGDQDRTKYLAIGESDRMTLKFVKPAGDKIFQPDGDTQPKPQP